MNKVIAVALVSISLALPVVSHAQFGGLGKMLGGNKESPSAGTDLVGQQDKLTGNYIAAGKDVVTANGHLAEALGIKAQAINASATSNSFSASDIENQDKAISADATAVSEALKSGASLKDSASKMKFSQGLISLVSGVKKYMGMRDDVKNFSSALSSASPMQLPKLQAGAYIAKSIPTSVSNLSTVLKSAVDFAKRNGVEVPADATSLI
jgi:hypothetical protein